MNNKQSYTRLEYLELKHQERESIVVRSANPTLANSQDYETNISMQRQSNTKETNNLQVSILILSMKLI